MRGVRRSSCATSTKYVHFVSVVFVVMDNAPYVMSVQVYKECSCIKKPSNVSAVPDMFRTLNGSSLSDVWTGFEAKNVTCRTQCGYLWYFVVLSFFVMVFTFLATMPALSATLRCVQDEQRSFALGIQWIVVRIFGTIPSPMIFGLIIDKTCVLWQSDCYGQGSCLAYDNTYMSRYFKNTGTHYLYTFSQILYRFRFQVYAWYSRYRQGLLSPLLLLLLVVLCSTNSRCFRWEESWIPRESTCYWWYTKWSKWGTCKHSLRGSLAIIRSSSTAFVYCLSMCLYCDLQRLVPLNPRRLYNCFLPIYFSSILYLLHMYIGLYYL